MNVNRQGYVLFVVGICLYSFSDAIMKYFMPSYGMRQIVFLRSIFRFIPFLLFALYQRTNPFKTNRLKENVFRAALASCGTYAYICAYNYAPMVDVFVVGLTTAIFTIPLSALILKEKFCRRNVVATLLGFAGICLAFRPGGGILQSENEMLQAGIALAVLGAFIAAVNQIMIKRLTFTENELTIIFYHHALLVSASFFIGLPAFSAMSLNHGLIIFAGGIIGSAAQYCIIRSFKLSEISKLAPFAYVMLIPDVIFDFFLYDKIPDAHIIGGLLLILVGAKEAMRKSL
jgi:drug/metabolite transporter (DMT)-like permease